MTTCTTPDYPPPEYVRTACVDLDNPLPVVDARALAVAVGWDWHLGDDTRETLRLVVGELVANVARHAARPLGWHAVPIRIERHPRGLVVEVSDSDPTMPSWSTLSAVDLDDVDRLDQDAPALISGRGGTILSALCESVGARPAGAGKVVRAVVVDSVDGPTDEELVDAYTEFFGVTLLDTVIEAVR